MTDLQLIALSDVVQNETVPGANTKVRIATLFKEIIDAKSTKIDDANNVKKTGSLVASGFNLSVPELSDEYANINLYQNLLEINAAKKVGANVFESSVSVDGQNGFIVEGKAGYSVLPTLSMIDEKGFVPKKYVFPVTQQIPDASGNINAFSGVNVYLEFENFQGATNLTIPAPLINGSFLQIQSVNSSGFPITLTSTQPFKVSENFSLPITAVTATSFIIQPPANVHFVVCISMQGGFMYVNASKYLSPVITP